ncbi:hypothetical protein FBBAL38_00135 [Flavobacteria bacterium BAL38]|nr:hypothetical protein FBBAL38_00135 [Flavobacteria bacterium BAL38]
MAIDLLKKPDFLVNQSQEQLIMENNDLKNNNLIFVGLFLALGIGLITLYVVNIQQDNIIKKLTFNNDDLK